jgi:putative phosphoribosyl transferase
MALFRDRRDAGMRLAAQLSEFRGTDALVLALPRGGVVTGFEVAAALGVPMDVFISRKIGAPGNPELAIGAVAEVDGLWLDQEAIALLGVSDEYVREETDRQRGEIRRRIQIYRRGQPLPPLAGRTAIVVDDGIATGYTMLAALKGIRQIGPGTLVVAVPVAAQESLWKVSREADRTVCLETPEPFYAVGFHYEDFEQLSDEDVVGYLERARRWAGQRRGQQWSQ